MNMLKKAFDWCCEKARSFVKPVALVTLAGAVTGRSFADGTPAFDYTSFSSVLTAGVLVVGSVAAAIAAVKAGVVVWKKIVGYFSKAG